MSHTSIFLIMLTPQHSIFWFVAALSSSSLIINIPAGDAYSFAVKHNPPNMSGGDCYANEIGDSYNLSVMQASAKAVSRLLGFAAADNGGKPVDEINLIIEEDMDDGKWASIVDKSDIHINARHIQDYDGIPVKWEFDGMVCHCMTLVLQWDGDGQAPRGLLTGIADFVRSKVHLRAKNWSLVGQRDRWDQGYEVTAHFLLYCDDLLEDRPFVAELNRKMKDGYDDDFFRELIGKTVDVLWSDYKKLYGGGLP